MGKSCSDAQRASPATKRLEFLSIGTVRLQSGAATPLMSAEYPAPVWIFDVMGVSRTGSRTATIVLSND
jgi:hypothetical protein